MMKGNPYLIPLLALMVSCTGQQAEGNVPQISEPSEAPARQTAVQPRILVSKGVIRSDNEVKVYSTIEGQLLDVKLIEGEKVRTGQVLFRLDDSDIAGKVALSESQYQQAGLKMEEILIGQGYRRDELDKVPGSTLEYARIKSGLNVSKTELDINRSLLGRTVISASQGGLVTGINALPYDFVKPGQTLCTIVDPDHLIVRFSILETELKKFSVGTQIEIHAIAYADVPHTATVRSIGSVVDESGMVTVEAVIEDTTNLMPGMSATISL